MTFGLVLTRKIAGPLCRFKLELDRMVDEDESVRPVYLRKGDFFHELADSLNRAIHHMQEQTRARVSVTSQ